MKQVLIISQDVNKIQAYTGFWGKVFSRLYLSCLKIRLKILIIILHPFCRLSTLTTSGIIPEGSSNYFYDQELAKLDYSANRSFYWDIAKNIFKSLHLSGSEVVKPLETRLVSYLAYNLFIYADLFKQFFNQQQPNAIITLGNSYHEQAGRFVARQQKIPVINLSWLSFSFLERFISRYLLNREYQQKLKLFFKQSRSPQPNLAGLNQSTLLSLDFFRHLKTLAPIYLKLKQTKKNPWFVTDIPDPMTRFKNIKLGQPQHVYIASFLPKHYSLKKYAVKLKNNLPLDKFSLFLCNLGVQAAQPLIKQGLILSQLYLLAGNNLLNQAKPGNLIVLFDTRFLETSLAALAKTHQVKSIMVSPNQISDLSNLNRYDNTDVVAVVGKYIKNKLIKLGISSEKIKIIGDLRFPRYGRYYQPLNTQLIFKKLKIQNNHKRIILLISFRTNATLPLAEKKLFFQTCYQTAKSFPNAVLVIKPHPTENRRHLKAELRQWGLNHVILSDNRHIEMIDLLNAASVVVETWSMTVFEAVLMNRPVISLNLSNKNYDHFLPVLKYGAAIQVKSASELSKQLKIILSDKSALQQQLKQAQLANELFVSRPEGQGAYQLEKLLS